MPGMNRTTMRYPKLEQTISAAECMLEFHKDEIEPGSEGEIEKNLSEMRDLDAEIKTIPYQSGDPDRDEANSRRYDGLEARARKLCDATAKLLWPVEKEA